MSNILGGEASFSSGNTGEEVHQENKLHQQPLNHSHGSSFGACNNNSSTYQQQQQQANRKKKTYLEPQAIIQS